MDSTTLDVIFITGAPGTGKSTVARNLQVKLKTPIFAFWVDTRVSGQRGWASNWLYRRREYRI